MSSSDHGSSRVVLAALGVNVAIAVLKFVLAAVTSSAAMLAEALHSLADSANQVFLLLGIRASRRAADEEHPFGYGLETYFWAFMAALSIFAVGGALSIYEGGKKLLHPDGHGIDHPGWAMAMLGVSVALECYSLFVAAREFRAASEGRPLRQALDEARDPTVITVLFEDIAALVGLLLALAGIGLATITGQAFWDGLASVLVGVVLVTVAAFLARGAKSLLVGRSVPEADRRRIETIARAHPDVLDVVHARTVHLGPADVMLGLKLRFRPDLDVAALEHRINAIESALRAALPQLRRIYVEPGFDERAARAPAGDSER